MKNKLKKPEKNYNILFDDLINKYKDLNNFWFYFIVKI
jgi:hypothetical protein